MGATTVNGSTFFSQGFGNRCVGGRVKLVAPVFSSRLAETASRGGRLFFRWFRPLPPLVEAKGGEKDVPLPLFRRCRRKGGTSSWRWSWPRLRLACRWRLLSHWHAELRPSGRVAVAAC